MKRPTFFFAERNLPFTVCGILIAVLCIALAYVSELRTAAPAFVPETTWIDGATAILLLLAFVPFWIAARFASERREPPDKRLIVVFSAVFVLTFFMTSGPVSAKDMFGYIFYGRSAPIYGQNPYAVVPSMRPQDPVLPFISDMWMDWKNPYGPAWTIISMAPALVAGEEVYDQVLYFDLIAVMFFFGSLYVLVRLMKELGRERDVAAAMLLFAWNPFLLYEMIQNGHNDIAMIFFMLLAFLLLARGKDVGAAVAYGASCLVKYSGLAIAPLIALYILTRKGPWTERARLAALVRFAAVVAGLAIALYAPFWRGGGVLAGFAEQGKLFDYHQLGAVPLHIFIASSDPAKAIDDPALAGPVKRLTSVVLAFAFAGFLWAVRKKAADMRGLMGASVIAFLILLSCVFWLMPWYYAWILPFLILLGRYPEAVFVTAVGLLSYQFPIGTLQVIGLVWFGVRELRLPLRKRLFARL